MKRLRNFLAGIATLGLGCLLALGLAELATRIVMPHWQDYASERFMRTTQVSGWAPFNGGVPGFDGWFAQNNGDFRISIRLDDLGLRNPADAEVQDAVWGVGDSFTFGWGIEREQIFAAVAAKQLGRPFLSVASPGTDICGYQALLSKALGKGWKPGAVLVGLTMENDISRYGICTGQIPAVQAIPVSSSVLPTMSRQELKEILLAHSALYNFVAVTLKRSPVVLDGLKALGFVNSPNDATWHMPHHGSDVLDATAREMARLRSLLPEGTPFAVVLIPARFDLDQPNGEWAQDREELTARLTALGMAVVDPTQALAAQGRSKVHFAHDGHWSALGHRIAGQAAAAALVPLLTKGNTP